MNVLKEKKWSDICDTQYSDSAISRLVKKIQVNEKSTIHGFRKFKDTINKCNTLELNPVASYE